MSGPYRNLPECDHGVTFDEAAWKAPTPLSSCLDAHEVRERWPRLDGLCPLGCGYRGIAYASMTHFVAGDW